MSACARQASRMQDQARGHQRSTAVGTEHYGYLTISLALCFTDRAQVRAAEVNLEGFCKEGEMRAGLISLAAGTDHGSNLSRD